MVDDEMVNQQIEAYRKNVGSYDQVEAIEEEDLVKGTVTELEAGKPKEGGIVVEDALLMPKYIKGKREQNKFIGAKLNSTVTFNPKKAYKGVDAEIASFLKVDKETAQDITADFQFEVKEITRHKEAELNKEFFDKIFGENEVETEEAFKEKVKFLLTEQYEPQSEYKFMLDIHKLLIKKAGDVKFADAILKRWFLASNNEMTPEKLEEDYPNIVENIIYQLAKEYIWKEYQLKVEDTELEELAKKTVRAQFAQYGMLSVPDNLIVKYVEDMLKKEETLRGLMDRAMDEKLAKWMNDQVKVETKEVTHEEFAKLLT
jgi:trigger factor